MQKICVAEDDRDEFEVEIEVLQEACWASVS